MKLAEALIQRADIQKRIASLKDRITRMAQVQEGDEPVEAPEKLIEKVRGASPGDGEFHPSHQPNEHGH